VADNPPRRSRPAHSLNDLTLNEVGLTPLATGLLSFMSLLPMVGIVLGWYYRSQRHTFTRQFGNTLFLFSIFLHFLYFCILCPLLAYIAFQQF
jgi:hypothetical protein